MNKNLLDIFNDIINRKENVNNLLEIVTIKKIDKMEIKTEEKEYLKEIILNVDKSKKIRYFVKFFNIHNILQNMNEIYKINEEKYEKNKTGKKEILKEIKEFEKNKEQAWGKNKVLYLFWYVTKNKEDNDKINNIKNLLLKTEIIYKKQIF